MAARDDADAAAQLIMRIHLTKASRKRAANGSNISLSNCCGNSLKRPKKACECNNG
jgi:hypothetical protein